MYDLHSATRTLAVAMIREYLVSDVSHTTDRSPRRYRIVVGGLVVESNSKVSQRHAAKMLPEVLGVRQKAMISRVGNAFSKDLRHSRERFSW